MPILGDEQVHTEVLKLPCCDRIGESRPIEYGLRRDGCHSGLRRLTFRARWRQLAWGEGTRAGPGTRAAGAELGAGAVRCFLGGFGLCLDLRLAALRTH